MARSTHTTLPRTRSVHDTRDRGEIPHLCFDTGCHRKKYVMRTCDPQPAPAPSFRTPVVCILSVPDIRDRVPHRQPQSGTDALPDKSCALSMLCCPQRYAVPYQDRACASIHCRTCSSSRQRRLDICQVRRKSNALRFFANIGQGHMPGMMCGAPRRNPPGTRRT